MKELIGAVHLAAQVLMMYVDVHVLIVDFSLARHC